MRKLAEYLSLALVALLMVFTSLTYLAPHFGWHFSAILDGNMEPTVGVGSLIVTHQVDPQKVVVGDVISFYPQQAGRHMETRRVVGFDKRSDLRFLTMGDANTNIDQYRVPVRNLVGRVVFTAPDWGYFIEFLKTPWGFGLGLIMPGVVLAIVYLVSVFQVLGVKKEVVAVVNK